MLASEVSTITGQVHFLSLRPVPQPLNIPAMDEIAGVTIGSAGTSSDSGSSSTTYAFSKPGPDDYAVLRTSFVSFVCTFGEVNCPSGVSTETSGRYEIYGNELFMYLSDGQTV
jgi:hypothetical protein